MVFAALLPENTLHLEELHAYSTIDTKKFVTIIQKLLNLYQPIAQSAGATLVIDGDWNSPLVNTYAKKEERYWYIKVYGGLAKRPEMMSDTLTLAVCHEIGHLMAGWPYINAEKHISAEGQADYFATQHCLQTLWEQSGHNENYMHMAPSTAIQLCNNAWNNSASQHRCYRMITTAYSLIKFISKAMGEEADLDLQPEEIPMSTILSYPSAQCRLETMVRGALCKVIYQPLFQWALSSERLLSAMQHCSRLNGQQIYGRPRCWLVEDLLF